MINDEMLHQSTISTGVLATKILYWGSFLAPNIYQKIQLCVFFRIWALKTFDLKKNDNIFAHKRNIGNRAHFPSWRW